MKKKHGARPGEITLTEAKKLIPGLKPYRAKKIFERMEHNGTARIGRRANPPCGACCYVDEKAWKITVDINRPIEPKRTIKKHPVESELHEEIETAVKEHFEKSEVHLLEPGTRTGGHKTEAAEHISDRKESVPWNEMFSRKAESDIEPEETANREQPAESFALSDEDQYSVEDIFDIISDFEVVERKQGTARAGSKAAVRLMKRSGVSNAFIDWCILGAAAGTLLFASFVYESGDNRTDQDRKNNLDQASDTRSSSSTPGNDIRSDRSSESRAAGDNVSAATAEHGTRSWFNNNK